MNYSLSLITDAMKFFQPQLLTTLNLKAASVAMIFRLNHGEIELLFIERAADPRDPWSGHIAFPGGKIEEGEDGCEAAIRETAEETGIYLNNESFLGQLSDLVGTNLPVQVSCYLFLLHNEVHPILNRHEVKDLFWFPLSELYNSHRQIQTTVTFSDLPCSVPAILLLPTDKPVLWGITYRLVMQLKDVLSSYNRGGCNVEKTVYTHEVEYL